MRRKRITDFLLLTVLSAGASGCAYMKPSTIDPRLMGPGSPGDPYASRVGGDEGLFTIGGGSKGKGDSGGGGTGIGVNAFLWRGALDTLSFLPLTSADPFGVVIITDWYTPTDAVGERFKATAYILGRELRSDGLRVSVFRQVNQGGRWVDAPVSPVTVSEIENKVLDRARKLREQTRGNG